MEMIGLPSCGVIIVVVVLVRPRGAARRKNIGIDITAFAFCCWTTGDARTCQKS